LAATATCLLFAALSVATLPLLSDTAEAWPQTFQANLLGWASPSGQGNRGELASADALLDSIAGSLSYGGDLPFAVMTEETCAATYGSGQPHQLAELFAGLSWVSSGTYAYTFVSKYVNHNPMCVYTGNAVFARANSASSKYADSTITLSDPQGLDQPRFAACIHPILALWTWTACVSHITTVTTNNLQVNQLNQYTDFYYNDAPGTAKRVGGDFNRINVTPPTYYITLNIDGWYTAPFKPASLIWPDKQIDYLFTFLVSPYSEHANSFAPPGCNVYGNCVNLQNQAVSDHFWLQGYA
jgi:hypothetical protein